LKDRRIPVDCLAGSAAGVQVSLDILGIRKEKAVSHRIELPDDLYNALDEAAKADGTTPIGWIASHLPKADNHEPDPGLRTLADLFRGRVGRIRSGGRERLSEDCGQKFADYLEQKRKEGRL
jgi:hypothetical protein